MPIKKVKHHPEHREPHTDKEAWECAVSALVYFFRKRPFKTAIAVILFFGAPGIVAYQYFTTDRVKIEEAKPINEVMQFDVQSRAFAQTEGPPIMWNNQKWGIEDTRYEAKVIQGQNLILIYDKTTKKVWKAEFYTDIKMRK